VICPDFPARIEPCATGVQVGTRSGGFVTFFIKKKVKDFPLNKKDSQA